MYKVSNHAHLIMSAAGGVAAKAGSVYLIYSMDWKLGQKGGARTYQQRHHPVAQGCPSSQRSFTTRSPQTTSLLQQPIEGHTMTS